jgi:hypothetical protein
MSTIYTFHAECSTIDAIAAGDRFLVWDTSTGRTAYATGTALLAYAGSAPTINGAMLNGTFSVSSSVIFGSTLSAKIGFYGKAGTSAPAGAAGVTATPVAITAAGFGISTSAKLENLLSLVDKMRTTLVDVGLMQAS